MSEVASVPEAATLPLDTRGQRSSYLVRVLKRPSTIISLVWIAIVVFVAIFSQQISPFDPLKQNLGAALQLPSGVHLFGTDQLGRDILSRIIFGAGETLIGALLTVTTAIVVGVPAGVLAGYYGGKFDALANRFAELVLTLPNIIVLLAVVTVFGNKLWIAMIALGVLLSAGFLRLARATTRSVRNELYVDAARVFGVRDPRILMRHILPNMLGPTVVQASITLCVGLLMQAGLGFLGLGSQPPNPNWGSLVAEASQLILVHPWLMVPTGLTIILTVLAFNFIGDAARDSLPQSERGNLLAVPKAARKAAAVSAAAPVTASAAAEVPTEVLMSVRDLVVSFPVQDKIVDIVKGISFDITRGTTLGLVGESGSGKTMTALALLGLVPAPGYVSGGQVLFSGHDLAAGGEKGYQGIRGKRIGLISQEPMVALDPCFRVSTHLRGPLMRMRGMTRKQADVEAIRLLETVGMRDPKAVFDSYPHQLSGGMAQRVCIAWALAGQPDLLIADEPTTALDVTVQAGILDLLRSLQRDLGMTVLIVTHDLGVVADVCDEVAVMHDGVLVEKASVEDIFERPQHEYTRSLLGHARALDRGLEVSA
jgi:peptide/nickel transport system permease protein